MALSESSGLFAAQLFTACLSLSGFSNGSFHGSFFLRCIPDTEFGNSAFLGHGWLGCSKKYEVPEQINWDYGEPAGLCKETTANSGIFEREWTKAKISMDCNTWTPTITLK